MYANAWAYIRKYVSKGALRWWRKYVKVRVKVRCGGEVGVVRGERVCTVAVTGDGRWRAECSWEGIRIYRNLSEFIGGNRIGSDKL